MANRLFEVDKTWFTLLFYSVDNQNEFFESLGAPHFVGSKEKNETLSQVFRESLGDGAEIYLLDGTIESFEISDQLKNIFPEHLEKLFGEDFQFMSDSLIELGRQGVFMPCDGISMFEQTLPMSDEFLRINYGQLGSAQPKKFILTDN